MLDWRQIRSMLGLGEPVHSFEGLTFSTTLLRKIISWRLSRVNNLMRSKLFIRRHYLFDTLNLPKRPCWYRIEKVNPHGPQDVTQNLCREKHRSGSY